MQKRNKETYLHSIMEVRSR